jgi:hypothetical protein
VDDGLMASEGQAAEAARTTFHEIVARKGHAVENARDAVAHLERAFAAGVLERTEALDQALRDLSVALARDEDQKLGGKSAEASRFIVRAIGRALADA